MKNTIYSVKTEAVVKVTVTISRRALWNNFVASWSDMVWNEYNGVDLLEKVAKVLLSGEKLNSFAIRQLFRDGNTYFLMGTAMEDIDRPNQLTEIVITDDDDANGTVRIPHHDINY